MTTQVNVVMTPARVAVAVTDTTVAVDVGPRVVQITGTDLVGPPGPAGAAAANVLTRTAVGTLSGHTAVKLTPAGAAPSSNTDAASRQLSIGVTTGAAVDGAPVDIQTSGILVEPGWTWTPAALIFLGAAGALTQTMPTAPAFCRVIGTAVSATEMWIDPQPPIVLT